MEFLNEFDINVRLLVYKFVFSSDIISWQFRANFSLKIFHNFKSNNILLSMLSLIPSSPYIYCIISIKLANIDELYEGLKKSNLLYSLLTIPLNNKCIKYENPS